MRPFLFLDNTERLIHAFITSSWTSVMWWSPRSTNQLQFIQNPTECVLRKTEGELMSVLFWSPPSGCLFILALILKWFLFSKIFTAKHQTVRKMIFVDEPGFPLRSSLVAVPQSRTRTFSDSAFSCYVPRQCSLLGVGVSEEPKFLILLNVD